MTRCELRSDERAIVPQHLYGWASFDVARSGIASRHSEKRQAINFISNARASSANSTSPGTG
jgi:hypothetical protein